MSAPLVVSTVTIYDQLVDDSGAAVVAATVEISLTSPQATIISPAAQLSFQKRTLTTDSNGYWSLSLVPTANISPANNYYVARVNNQYSYTFQAPTTPGSYQSTGASCLVNSPTPLGGLALVAGSLSVTALTAGSLAVTGETALAGDTTIAADDGVALILTGVAGFQTLDLFPKMSNAGGLQGLTMEVPTDPGAITADAHLLAIKGPSLTFHGASFTGASNFYLHEILAPTYNFDAAFAFVAGTVGTLLVQGPAAGSGPITNANGSGLGPHYAIQASGGVNALGSANDADFYNNALVANGGFTVLNSRGNQNGNPMGIHPDYASGLDVIPSSGGIGTVLVGVNFTALNNWGVLGAFDEIRYVNLIAPTVLSNTGVGSATAASVLKVGAFPVAGAGMTITDRYSIWALGKVRIDNPLSVTSPSNQAFYVEAVAGQGKIWQIDASAATAANGLKLTASAAGAGVALVVQSTGATNEALSADAKGSGAMTLQGTATGPLNVGSHLVSTLSGTPSTGTLGVNVTSATFTGNDVRGKIVIVMSGVLAANTRIATCTWAATFGAVTPLPLLVSETSGAGLAIVNFYSGAESATAFDLFCEQALAAGTYTVRYINIG